MSERDPSLEKGNCWQVWAKPWELVHKRGERKVWSGGLEGN